MERVKALIWRRLRRICESAIKEKKLFLLENPVAPLCEKNYES